MFSGHRSPILVSRDISNPQPWLETCPIERAQQPHANRRSLHLATELLSLLWDGLHLPLQIWYPIRYRRLLKCFSPICLGVAKQSHMSCRTLVRRDSSVHGGLRIQMSVQDENGYPAVRRVFPGFVRCVERALCEFRYLSS